MDRWGKHRCSSLCWKVVRLLRCGLFFFLQDEEAVKRLTASAGTKSKLPKPVQELIKMIFDVESMKKAMVEFEVRSLHFSLFL